MAEPDEGKVEKKLSKFSIEFYNRINNKLLDWINRGSHSLARVKSVYTPTFIPVEMELKKEHIIDMLGSYVSTLKTIESTWALLKKYWVKILNCYGGMGVKRGEEITGDEIWMCKFGPRFTPREIQQAREMELFDRKSEAKKEAAREKKVKVTEAIAEEWKSKYIEYGDLNEKRREEFRRALCPLDNPNNVEWRPIKLKIRKNKEIMEEFPLPREIRVKTWHSLIDDVNFALDRYPVRFFGFEKYEDWTNALSAITERLCRRVLFELQKSKDYQKLVEDRGKTYAEDCIINRIMPAFSSLMTEEIVEKVVLFDGTLYPYLRTRTQQWGGRISAWEGDVNGLMPSSIPVNIHFRRTYKMIDPRRIIKARIYNNGYLLYKELVRLNKLFFPKERFTEREWGLTLGNIRKFKEFEDAVEIPKISDEDLAEMEDADLDEATTTKGPFQNYFNYKHDNSAQYAYCIDIEKKLKKAFEKVNDRLKEKHIPGYYLTWGMMGIEDTDAKIEHMDEIGVDENGWPKGERSPGLDENGWPFEVWEDGRICLDKWEKRKERSVPEEFVKEMDMLLKINIMNNEYDAIRDDIRDGRYHINSLTIYEYILAGMAKWAPERSKLIGKEFKNRWMSSKNLTDKDAEFEMKIYDETKPKIGKRRPSDLSPAFDLRAFEKGTAKMNNWWHLGRKRYYDTAKDILDQLTDKDLQDEDVLKAIGPTLTTRGLSMYIIEKVVANVRNIDNAGKILVRIANESGAEGGWYDYGPRGFNKDGPKNPFQLKIEELTSSLEAEDILKIYGGVTEIKENITENVDASIDSFD